MKYQKEKIKSTLTWFSMKNADYTELKTRKIHPAPIMKKMESGKEAVRFSFSPGNDLNFGKSFLMIVVWRYLKAWKLMKENFWYDEPIIYVDITYHWNIMINSGEFAESRKSELWKKSLLMGQIANQMALELFLRLKSE